MEKEHLKGAIVSIIKILLPVELGAIPARPAARSRLADPSAELADPSWPTRDPSSQPAELERSPGRRIPGRAETGTGESSVLQRCMLANFGRAAT